MASSWIRWNTATHIFERSTDSGATWPPLALDAAIINEGSLADARLSANVPLKDAANVFTNALPASIESAAPILQFKETDAAADLKLWRHAVDAQIFKVQKLTDALAATDLFTLNRDGQVTINPTVAGYGQDIVSSLIGIVRSRIRNANNSASSGAGFNIGTDAGTIGELLGLATSYSTTGAYIAGGVTLSSTGVGGLNLIANHASGALKLFTGASGSPRLTVSAGGDASFSGTISERGRSTPLGEWTSIAYSAGIFTSNTGTWTVDSGDVATLAYTFIGKTAVIIFNIQSSSVGGVGSDLMITLPFTSSSTHGTVANSISYSENATFDSGYAVITAGSTLLRLRKINNGNWGVTANATSVYGMITIPIN